MDRVNAFKTGILTRMGLTGPPRAGPGGHGNVTGEARRAALRLYRQSLEEQSGHVHELYEGDEDERAFLAKQFHSFGATGKSTFLTFELPVSGNK